MKVTRTSRLARALMAPVDVASLSAFRSLFGFIMAVALLRFALRGYAHAQLVAPSLHFPYEGLAFVEVLPESLMQLLIAVLVVAAMCVGLGIYTRVSACVFACGFTYVELIDQTHYLNHYYLVALLSFLLVVLPVGRAHAVDNWLKPGDAVDTIPFAYLAALRLQVAVVYLFAGVAKLNADWLIEAQPMRMWLAARSDLLWVGPWLAEPWFAYAASWAGAAFDLTIIPLMLSRRARRFAFGMAVLFHFATGVLFPIGVFPWLMTACLTLFFEPSWPRFMPLAPRPGSPVRALGASRALFVLLMLHCAVQVALPLVQYRHEDSTWSYPGFNFAWRVMAMEKPGDVVFRVEEPRSGR